MTRNKAERLVNETWDYIHELRRILKCPERGSLIQWTKTQMMKVANYDRYVYLYGKIDRRHMHARKLAHRGMVEGQRMEKSTRSKGAR